MMAKVTGAKVINKVRERPLHCSLLNSPMFQWATQSVSGKYSIIHHPHHDQWPPSIRPSHPSTTHVITLLPAAREQNSSDDGAWSSAQDDCSLFVLEDVSQEPGRGCVLLDVPLPPASAQGCEVSESYCSNSIADPGNLPWVVFLCLDIHLVVYFF